MAGIAYPEAQRITEVAVAVAQTSPGTIILLTLVATAVMEYLAQSQARPFIMRVEVGEVKEEAGEELVQVD
jgi:hypothetical protein